MRVPHAHIEEGQTNLPINFFHNADRSMATFLGFQGEKGQSQPCSGKIRTVSSILSRFSPICPFLAFFLLIARGLSLTANCFIDSSGFIVIGGTDGYSTGRLNPLNPFPSPGPAVAYTPHVVNVGPAAILVWELTASYSQYGGFAINNDLNVNGDDSAPCYNFYEGNGFSAGTGVWTVSFFFRSHPLVTDVSTYWFGSLGLMASNTWNQVTDSSFGPYSDSAMAWSWQDLWLSSTPTFVSVFLHWGDPPSNPPVLSITSGPWVTPSEGSVYVDGVLTSSDYAQSSVIAVFDGNPWPIAPVATIWSGSFSGSFDFNNVSLAGGSHLVTFYAIDSRGGMSDPAGPYSIAFYPRTPRRTPRAQDSYPTVGAAGSSVVSMGRNYGVQFLSSSAFMWRVRVTNVGAAAIIAIVVQAHPGLSASYSVAFSGDYELNGQDGPAIYSIGSGQGFYARAGTVTHYFLCGSQPMVVTPSTYWFGWYGDTSGCVWSQTSASSYTSDSGIAVSWQGLYVPPLGRKSVSIVVRSGAGSIPPVLTLASASVSSGYLRLTGSVTDDDMDLMSVYAAFDGNYGDIVVVVAEIYSGDEFDQSVSLDSWYLQSGTHNLEVFAIDHSGSFSSAETRSLHISGSYGSSYLSYEYGTVPYPTHDARLKIWEIALIAAGAVIVATALFARLIYSYCRYIRPKANQGAPQGAEAVPGFAETETIAV
jgi:hypothetical protein